MISTNPVFKRQQELSRSIRKISDNLPKIDILHKDKFQRPEYYIVKDMINHKITGNTYNTNITGNNNITNGDRNNITTGGIKKSTHFTVENRTKNWQDNILLYMFVCVAIGILIYLISMLINNFSIKLSLSIF